MRRPRDRRRTSRHIGEPEKQTLETLHNLQALIDHLYELHIVRNGRGQALFKAYIRHPEHVATAKVILAQHLPVHAQVLCLEGAPCRNELPLEIEGILASGSEQESL